MAKMKLIHQHESRNITNLQLLLSLLGPDIDDILPWRNRRPYTIGEAVIHPLNLGIYECIEDHTSEGTFDEAKFKKMASLLEIVADGTGLNDEARAEIEGMITAQKASKEAMCDSLLASIHQDGYNPIEMYQVTGAGTIKTWTKTQLIETELIELNQNEFVGDMSLRFYIAIDIEIRPGQRNGTADKPNTWAIVTEYGSVLTNSVIGASKVETTMYSNRAFPIIKGDLRFMRGLKTHKIQPIAKMFDVDGSINDSPSAMANMSKHTVTVHSMYLAVAGLTRAFVE